MAARGLEARIVAVTGTPGCGKSAITQHLARTGIAVLALDRFVDDPRFDEGPDPHAHDAHVIDEAALSDHLLEHLGEELVAAGVGSPDDHDAVLIDSHFGHEIAFVDRIIVLRTRPDVLVERLRDRAWPEAKVAMNVAAEAQGVIATESYTHADEAGAEGHTIQVIEYDTSAGSVEDNAANVLALATMASENVDIRRIEWPGKGET